MTPDDIQVIREVLARVEERQKIGKEERGRILVRLDGLPCIKHGEDVACLKAFQAQNDRRTSGISALVSGAVSGIVMGLGYVFRNR